MVLDLNGLTNSFSWLEDNKAWMLFLNRKFCAYNNRNAIVLLLSFYNNQSNTWVKHLRSSVRERMNLVVVVNTWNVNVVWYRWTMQTFLITWNNCLEDLLLYRRSFCPCLHVIPTCPILKEVSLWEPTTCRISPVSLPSEEHKSRNDCNKQGSLRQVWNHFFTHRCLVKRYTAWGLMEE